MVSSEVAILKTSGAGGDKISSDISISMKVCHASLYYRVIVIHHKPVSQIPQRACPPQYTIQKGMDTCLFWMIHCGIWDKCSVEFVRLVYFTRCCVSMSLKQPTFNTPSLLPSDPPSITHSLAHSLTATMATLHLFVYLLVAHKVPNHSESGDCAENPPGRRATLWLWDLYNHSLLTNSDTEEHEVSSTHHSLCLQGQSRLLHSPSLLDETIIGVYQIDETPGWNPQVCAFWAE